MRRQSEAIVVEYGIRSQDLPHEIAWHEEEWN